MFVAIVVVVYFSVEFKLTVRKYLDIFWPSQKNILPDGYWHY